MSIHVNQFHWTAGFLEGDGSFNFGKAGHLAITAAQVQLWPLEKLQSLFGGSISKRKKDERYNSQPIQVWTLTGSSAAGLMMTLYSLMTEKRKEQIRKALSGWRMRPVSHKFKTSCPKGHPYNAENTRIMKNGSRSCITCIRERDRLRIQRRRSK